MPIIYENIVPIFFLNTEFVFHFSKKTDFNFNETIPFRNLVQNTKLMQKEAQY